MTLQWPATASVALRSAQVWNPDAILLDICMPGMNGNDVAKQLRYIFQDQVLLIAVTGAVLMRTDFAPWKPASTTFLSNPPTPAKSKRFWANGSSRQMHVIRSIRRITLRRLIFPTNLARELLSSFANNGGSCRRYGPSIEKSQ